MRKSVFRFNCGNLEHFAQMLCKAIKQHTDESGGLYLTPDDIHYIMDSYRYLLLKKAIEEDAAHNCPPSQAQIALHPQKRASAINSTNPP